MTLTAGTRLGPYEILAPIGAGGMGEVYKATDTRLDRTVAIKVLPEHLAESPERKARFEREAKAISQLNHPHICTLYDVGEQDDVDFIVMEYIEGETLAERLKKGALQLGQVLQYGIQIADALDKAHRAGIIHRDLKPGNVMLTRSGVKLVDFGLARLVGEQAAVEGSDAPTQQRDLAKEQAIVGTLQYMAPEQLEGRAVDARTDLFALGVVLYEMFSGKKAFEGESQASLISAILKDEPPPVSTYQGLSPSLLDGTIGKCLAKDPGRRWQTARDLGDELTWIAASRPSGKEPNETRSRWPISRGAGVTLLAAVLLAGLVVGRYSRVALVHDSRVSRFAVNLPEPLAVPPLRPAVALSPDGRNLVYVAGRPGRRQLYLRPLDDVEGHPIPGTEGATSPFFSPDGRWVGFFTQGKLKKVSLAGGSLVDICDTPTLAYGGTWAPDNTIVFALGEEGLRRVSSREGSLVYGPASGGDPSLVSIDRSGHVERLSASGRASTAELSGMEPRLSPDGRRLVTVKAQEDLAVWISELQRGTVTRLTFGGMDTAPVWTPDGTRITYTSHGDIYWIRADGSSEPEPLLVKEEVSLRPGSWSPDGQVLAFMQVTSAGIDVWTLRPGEEPEPFVDSPFNETSPAFSPNGRWLAYVSDESGRNEVYVRPFPGPGGKVPISSDGGTEPLWAPDGRELFYRSDETMMAAPIDDRNGFLVGIPVALFEQRSTLSPVDVAEYAVTPDGEHFIMGQGTSFALTRLRVVLNWRDELERLVPTNR